MNGQPLFHQVHHRLLILLLTAGILQGFGHGHIAGNKFSFLFSPNPKHMLIFRLTAVGVFQGDLGFANTAQPRKSNSSSAAQRSVNGFK